MTGQYRFILETVGIRDGVCQQQAKSRNIARFSVWLQLFNFFGQLCAIHTQSPLVNFWRIPSKRKGCRTSDEAAKLRTFRACWIFRERGLTRTACQLTMPVACQCKSSSVQSQSKKKLTRCGSVSCATARNDVRNLPQPAVAFTSLWRKNGWTVKKAEQSPQNPHLWLV
jgi:hypothetical protein